ncbi:hypothetical protein pipiens_002447 [Culex pipiens pipiens]|uniref:Odorant receptor n=1 Tax=Culex pipiens pipiens TaxID=38569 RepID=A0ABD1DG68_CULPP
MDHIAKVRAKFDLAKLRIIRLWQSIPDCFWLLDRLLIAADINVNPQNRLQKVSWVLHRLLGYSQMCLAFLGLTSALLWLDDVFGMFWSVLIFCTTVHCLTKCYLLRRHLGKLQPMVEKVFFLTYYFALGAIGCTIYLVHSVPFSYINCGILASLAGFSLEILLLGYQVETLRDTFETTAGLALTLCAQLPYSDDQRQEYVELRTSLSIVGLCSRNVTRFGCAGIPNISVAVFAELLHTTYSVMTFLLNTV